VIGSAAVWAGCGVGRCCVGRLLYRLGQLAQMIDCISE
jgi:hypothetical protein